jgi:hypothetical protein
MRGDVCRMHPADPATAEHSNPEQEKSSRFEFSQ